MVRVSFWGGVGRIGSTKAVVEAEGVRLILDLGLEFSTPRGLFREGLRPRPEHALRDRLRTGEVPALSGIFRTDAVDGSGVEGAQAGAGRTAVFITHGHLDHAGLVGFVDPTIPLYASPETVAVVRAFRAAGAMEGGPPVWTPLAADTPVTVGPFTVTRYPVDHDVAGASGYLIETPDGKIAYPGDFRLHGRHPDLSLAFAERVRGARALILEGTTLSFDPAFPERSETEADAAFGEILGRAPGLVLLSLYVANVERVESFRAIAREAGRTLWFVPRQADFLEAFGLGEVLRLTPDALRLIRRAPGEAVLALGFDDLPWLLDLPVGPGAVFVHANGEPFGFEPRFAVLTDWLRFTHTPYWDIGSGGHALPGDLARIGDIVRPDILFPVHSQTPERMPVPPGTRLFPPARGRCYPLRVSP